MPRFALRSGPQERRRLARLQDGRNTPFTPGVPAFYALLEALREYDEEGGRQARYRHYAALAERVRAGLASSMRGRAIYPKRCFESRPWVA